jgi:hypothetical protein
MQQLASALNAFGQPQTKVTDLSCLLLSPKKSHNLFRQEDMDHNQKHELALLRQRLERLERERSPLARFYAENRRWIRFFAISFIMTGLIVHATVPNVFMAGTPISAAQMNQNFSHLENLARGTIVAEISGGPLSLNYTHLTANADNTHYHLGDYPLVGTVISSDSNVILTTNGFQVYQVPTTGWYEVYVSGQLFANIHTDNYPTENHVNVDLSLRTGVITGGNFLTKAWHAGIYANMGVRDYDEDGIINVSDPLEYWTFNSRGESRKLYLLSGDSLSIVLGGNLKLPLDTIGLNSYKLTIKRISL